ncbi:MAG TPA: hypothetical protein VNJ01_17815 [Bacteriovoracaceae bacterium]|nr:hypothetical protein [Bacteriovoracaceae bacterium]
MKNLFLISIQVSVLCLLVSCGKDKAEKKEMDKFFNQYQNGACGLDVVSDYNSMAIPCRYITTRDEIPQCRTLVQQMMSKYPGISCEAEKGSGLSKEKFTIDTAHLQAILTQLDKM